MIIFTGRGKISEEFSKRFECKILSVRNVSDLELKNEFRNAKVVVHNAANLTCMNIGEAVNDNFVLTKRILDILYEVNPDAKFLYLSSMSILETDIKYKEPEKMSLYALSKYMGEIYCLKHPLESLSCIRFSTIFYNDDKKDGLSNLIWTAVKTGKITLLNNGEGKRDFLPIDILVGYLEKIIDAEHIDRKLNIASGNSTSFYDLAEIIRGSLLTVEVDTVNGHTEPVLNDFEKSDVIKLGEIQFNLKSSVLRYIELLRR